MFDQLPESAKKGRGAVGNQAGRFESQVRYKVDDGWWRESDPGEEKPPTILRPDAARSVLTRNQSPDVPFDRSINPYRGCEHGCVYCFARPSHSFLNLSPGLDFETRIFHKERAAELLAAELRKPRYKPAPIALGVNTDAYQPAERDLGITRSILRVLSDFNHPVAIITKSAGVLRDLDILAPMAERNLVHAMISITTLDADLARLMEPRAAAPSRRLEVLRELNQAGVPTGVLVAPVIPGLTDHELESILKTAAEAGAFETAYMLLRLPFELKEIFVQWLETHYSDRASKILSLIRQCRAGGLNQTDFTGRMIGSGPYAQLIHSRFENARKKFGLAVRPQDFEYSTLDTSQFFPPPAKGDQLGLF